MAKHPIVVGGRVPEVEEIAEILARTRFRPMPPAREREEWLCTADGPGVREWLERVTASAMKAAAEGPPPVLASDYLSYFRTGSRAAHSGPSRNRMQALAALTVAECFGNDGRFLDALLDVSWAVCEETSWIMPPHLHSWHDQPLPDAYGPCIDLRVATVGRLLAEMLHLLGREMDAVTPMWRRRVQHELERQVVTAYLTQECHWERAQFNWNAVCTAGVVAAALLGDFDVGTRALVLHKALQSAGHFLSGFTGDGGCSEGPGYWRYGMGNYSILAYYVDCATGGEIDLLADPVLPAVYAYPAAAVLSGDTVVNFADCSRTVGFRSGPIAWAADRLGVASTVALASGGRPRRSGGDGILDAYLTPVPSPGDFAPPAEAFLPELMLAVFRGDGAEGERLVLAAKGGHNSEHHNHNDVGNFIVHWRGESLICDLGRGEYVRDFFGPLRYEFLTTRSCGHNVPLINGFEQPAGRDFAARSFEREESAGLVGVAMGLSAAYPAEAGLASLRRRLVLRRGPDESVELTDDVRFAGEGRRYELPLFTEGAFESAGHGGAVARGRAGALRLTFDPEVVEARVESVGHGDQALAERYGPELPRMTLSLRGEPREATVRVLFLPEA